MKTAGCVLIILVVASVMTACSRDSFEKQAERDVGRLFVEELGLFLVDDVLETIRIEDFRLGHFIDEGFSRVCQFSFSMSAVVDGKRNKTQEVTKGKALFARDGDEWETGQHRRLIIAK